MAAPDCTPDGGPAPDPPPRRQPPGQRGFLASLKETGNVRRACQAAQVSRRAAYYARERHPDFAAAWDEALEEAADRLEAEARRRAVDGLVRFKFDRRGRPIRHPLA